MTSPRLLRLCLVALLGLLGGAAGARVEAPAAGDALPATEVLRVAGAPTGEALAGAALDERTEKIAALLRCPVCQGMSIADSPSSLAREMKQLVRQMLAAGYAEPQILNYFVHSYGSFVLLRPPLNSASGAVWIAPVAALLLGAFVLAVWARRALPSRPAAVAGAVAATPPPTGAEGATPELAPYLDRIRRLTSSASPAPPPRGGGR